MPSEETRTVTVSFSMDGMPKPSTFCNIVVGFDLIIAYGALQPAGKMCNY
jgi:hypothetical protein